MITIRHIYKDEKEIYTAIYLDDLLLVDWLGKNSTVEFNDLHPAVIEAEHKNIFLDE